jgi:hydrogenase maturation protein HypF
VPSRVDVRPTIRAIIDDRDRGTNAAIIAARFHATLVAVVVHVCSRIRIERGLNDVVLTGGVFQNRKLASSVAQALAIRRFAVFRHRAVPMNDSGIAYGQAAIGAARLRSAKAGTLCA